MRTFEGHGMTFSIVLNNKSHGTTFFLQNLCEIHAWYASRMCAFIVRRVAMKFLFLEKKHPVCLRAVYNQEEKQVVRAYS